MSSSQYNCSLTKGQRKMTGLGVYHYGSRFYLKLGRFLSADTVISNFADPQSLNRYSYVGNSPLNYTDPSGHMRIQDGDQNDRYSQSLAEKYVPKNDRDDDNAQLQFLPPPVVPPTLTPSQYETSAVGAATIGLGMAAMAAATSTCTAGPECVLIVTTTFTFATLPLVGGGLALIGVGGYEAMHHVEHNLNITITSLPMNRA
jgi:RHS repeat-associated protein